MSGEDERQFARALIAQVLEEYARSEISAGHAAAQRRGGGGRSPRRSTPPCSASAGSSRCWTNQQIENIDINGCDRVFLSYADGRETMGEPVAETDEELIELIQMLAAYSGLSSRPFDTANPQLDLRLPDGSRLSAVMDVTCRPSISIRRARMGKVFLADLVGNGTMTPEVGALPRGGGGGAQEHHDRRGDERRQDHAAARAGQPDPGRTSGSSPSSAPSSSGLDQFPELHPNVVAFEERLPNMRGPGRDLAWPSWSAAPCG